MSELEPVPEADCAPGAPHPRHAPVLYGQEAAEARFLEAFTGERLHHAWLITGPQGVGKATLAWRIARFLLSQPIDQGGGLFGEELPPADSLNLDPEHPVARRVAQLSEPRLCLIRRQWDAKKNKFTAGISVDEVRKLNGFFQLSAADGGRRVVIVDAADDMNVASSNALLKTLEEPPENAFILLICHQPARLLPTIRSRCRELRLGTLSPEDLTRALAQAGFEAAEQSHTLSELSAGSVGDAIRLSSLEGDQLYDELMTLFDGLPRLDRPRALKLAESCVGAQNQERLQLMVHLLDLLMARLAKTGAGHPPHSDAVQNERALFARLCPDPIRARDWAALSAELQARARHAMAVNLDPAALLMDTFIKINDMAARSHA